MANYVKIWGSDGERWLLIVQKDVDKYLADGYLLEPPKKEKKAPAPAVAEWSEEVHPDDVQVEEPKKRGRKPKAE